MGGGQGGRYSPPGKSKSIPIWSGARLVPPLLPHPLPWPFLFPDLIWSTLASIYGGPPMPLAWPLRPTLTDEETCSERWGGVTSLGSHSQQRAGRRQEVEADDQEGAQRRGERQSYGENETLLSLPRACQLTGPKGTQGRGSPGGA